MHSFHQLHSDGSETVLSDASGCWKVQLFLHNSDGVKVILIWLHAKTLEEAKLLARRATERNAKHLCTEQCEDWQPC